MCCWVPSCQRFLFVCNNESACFQHLCCGFVVIIACAAWLLCVPCKTLMFPIRFLFCCFSYGTHVPCGLHVDAFLGRLVIIRAQFEEVHNGMSSMHP